VVLRLRFYDTDKKAVLTLKVPWREIFSFAVMLLWGPGLA
jgi:hypothetical protein